LRVGLICVAVGVAGVTVTVVGLNLLVVLSVDGEGSSDLTRVPHAQTALMLGALVEPDGRMSSMLADRVDGAVRLWRAGRVQRILVSGDRRAYR
jgi:SanA protein